MGGTAATPNEAPEHFRLRNKALSRWDNEGGACPDLASKDTATEMDNAAHAMTRTELVHLRARVIALENLVISLLAGATRRQADFARQMVDYITPRPGFTEHPLTIHAASHMGGIIERAVQFGTAQPAPQPYKRTAIFDEASLPAGLRKEHRTKQGVWGVIRVLEGRLRFRVLDPLSEDILEPGHPGLILPDQAHYVEPLGRMKMQVEFYDQHPHL